MKMKNTMISNHCNNIDPLSTAVSTETSLTSELCNNTEKKKKKTFFSKVKAIFSKSSTEAQKKVSGPLHNAVKNTYVVRENHGNCSNDLEICRQLNEETNSENSKIYDGVDMNLTENQRTNRVFVNNDNLVNPIFENLDSVYPSDKNNGSWLTTSTNTSQGTEMNFRDLFTEQTTLSKLVDVGVQTKIPSCYKVYVLHKHVSNCNGRNKSNSKIKKKKFINTDKYKRSAGNKRYYYYNDSSTQSINTDESHSGDIMNGKVNMKYWRDSKTRTNKNVFNKSARYYETNNMGIEWLDAIDKPPRHSKVLNINSNSNDIIIDNDGRPKFYGTCISSSNSSSFDSIESKKLKYRKTKVNYETTETQTNEPHRQEEANAEGSQSKSLPSLDLLRKNKSIKEIKCNSSPLVSQNTIQTRMVKKRESIRTTFVKNSINKKGMKNTVLQPFRTFHKNNGKENKENHKKKQSVNKTTSISSKISSSDNSNSTYEIKEKPKINNAIKIKEKGNQISENIKLSKLKIKHFNSNSTTDTWQTKKSEIRNDDLNTIIIDKNVIKPKEHNSYQNNKIETKEIQTYDQNDHLINTNYDNLKLNRRPIITQPMIFFKENKSKEEHEMFDYFFNKSFAKKNLKIPLDQQYLNPFKVNYNDPIIRNIEKYSDVLTHEPKKKFKNRKNKDNSTSPPLAMNKQKFGNFIKNSVNNPLNIETNGYVCIKEKHNKRSNARFFKNQDPNCIQLGQSGKTLKKTQKINCTSWKPSSEILKSSNLTEISFECILQNNQCHKNKQVNKKTQKNWNENYSPNKSNFEKKFNKDSKNFNQERRMLHEIQAEKLILKNLSSNVGVHGAFSGNITSKRKTFFAKIPPIAH